MVSAPPGIALDVSAEPFVPERKTLPALREAVQGCRGCDLYSNATQAVFGEGARDAEVLFVGEQPGDKEDLAGKPFVGPAGQLLDQALEEAGIDRSQTYVTNAVKHFKWQARGKRRIHQKPSWSEVPRAVRGSRPSSTSSGRASSSAWVRPRRSPSSAATSASRSTEANCSIRTSPST